MTDSLSADDKRNRITVLLAEYNTLRTECQHRLTILIQSSLAGLTALTVIIGWSFTSSDRFVQLYWGLSIVVLYIIMLVLIHLNVTDLSKRLRQIERQINALNDNVPLLIWESKYGWGGAYPRSRKQLKKMDEELDRLDCEDS